MAIGFGAKEKLIRTFAVTMRGKLAVDKVNCHLEGIAPKFLWNRRVGEKSKGSFNSMVMFAFNNANVFRGIRWVDKMGYPMVIEIMFEFEIFNSTISVNRFDFVGEKITFPF